VILSLVLAVEIGTEVELTPHSSDLHEAFYLCWVVDQTCVSFTALLLSTTLGGMAAMWLWLVAPTAHILLASRFLMLNWSMALLFAMIVSSAYKYKHSRYDYVHVRGIMALRILLVVVELPFLQFLVKHRMKSIWPALQQRHLKQIQEFIYFVEVCFLCFCLFCIVLPVFMPFDDFLASTGFAVAGLGGLVSFLLWVLSVAALLCRAFFTFHGALIVCQVGGLTNARKALQSCRTMGLLQVTGLATSAATSAASVVVALFSFSGPKFLPAMMVIQSINTVINAASVIYLSGAFRLLTKEAPPPPVPFFRSCSCRKRKALGHRSKRILPRETNGTQRQKSLPVVVYP